MLGCWFNPEFALSLLLTNLLLIYEYITIYFCLVAAAIGKELHEEPGDPRKHL